MAPEQLALVVETLAALDLDALASDFYARATSAEPALAAMFTTDAVTQRARFTAELAQIVAVMASADELTAATHPLGLRHRRYGVRAGHYRVMGVALLAALAAALGPRWTPEVEDAWALAYNLTAESMMAGAMDDPTG